MPQVRVSVAGTSQRYYEISNDVNIYIGYIGGSVLHRLLHHPNAKTFDVTALARSPEKAEKLESFGVKPVIGSLDDHTLVEELSSQAHVIFNTVCTYTGLMVNNKLIHSLNTGRCG